MGMNGIDISGHQQGIDLAVVPCDFVIIKATQGVSFINPDFKRQVEQALSLGKLVGLYHYATGADEVKQIEHFADIVAPYLGRVILALDWEGQDNNKFSDYKFCERLLVGIKNKTGRTPFLYMSKSVARQYKWEVGKKFPFWCAQYKKIAPTTYVTNPWTDSKGWGAWTGCKILQYSSKGRLNGYKGDLDLDLAYMDVEEWQAYASGEAISEPIPTEPKNYPTLKKGSQNEYVRAWQTFLNLNGYDCGVNDGIFGQKTLNAVKAWQKNHGLTPDGIIGPKTWASLPII